MALVTLTPRARTAVRWAVGLGVLAALVSTLDTEALLARFGSINVALAAPAIAGLVGVHLVAAMSWRRLTWHLAGVGLDWRTTVRLYYAGQALGTVTPANVGADIYRVIAVDQGAGRLRIARPVIIQRLTSIGALLLLGLVGALAVPIDGLGMIVAALIALSIVIIAIAAVFARGAMTSSSAGLLAGPVQKLLVGLAARSGLEAATAVAAASLRSALRDGLGLGLVFHGLSVLLGLVLVTAVEPSAVTHPVEVLAALAIARLALAVPISPNGIGIQEGALAILFVQLGLPADVALAAAFLNRLALLITAAIGAIALASGSNRQPSEPRLAGS